MKLLSRILPHVSAALCALCLILLAVDLFFPDLFVFLNEGVKLLVLVTGLVTAVSGGLLIARERRPAPRRRRTKTA